MRIKVVTQRTLNQVASIIITYGVIIDNKPKYIFKRKEELESFLRGLHGTRG